MEIHTVESGTGLFGDNEVCNFVTEKTSAGHGYILLMICYNQHGFVVEKIAGELTVTENY